MKLSEYQVDTDKLDHGIWWNFKTEQTCGGNKPHESDPCFLIVPNISGRYLIALAEEQLGSIEILRQAMPEDEEGAEEHRATVRGITRKTRADALYRTTLKGWAGIEGEDGKPYAFSKSRAKQMLHNRAFLVFHDFIERAATNRDAALIREEAKAQGN